MSRIDSNQMMSAASARADGKFVTPTNWMRIDGGRYLVRGLLYRAVGVDVAGLDNSEECYVSVAGSRDSLLGC